MRWKEWGAFLLLGTLWGSSFLWIKIGVQEIGPLTLVAFRLFFGLIGLLVAVWVTRQKFPRTLTHLAAYLFMGVFGTAAPFVLISWGETRIDSGVAAILNGTTPLSALVIAHFWLADERMTLTRMAGLVIGFIGVVILVSRDIGPQGIHGNLWGQLAVLAAATSYAVAATFSRRHLRGHPPLVQALMVVLIGDALAWLAVPFAERPFRLPQLPLTWIALVWLGLLGSCVAYLLYFYLINTWGATRATVVTYVFPVVGLLLGSVFLNEVADWRLLLGTGLVVAGITIVNRRIGAPTLERTAAPAQQKT